VTGADEQLSGHHRSIGHHVRNGHKTRKHCLIEHCHLRAEWFMLRHLPVEGNDV